MNKKHQAFIKADLSTQVRMATPLAQRLLLSGVNGQEMNWQQHHLTASAIELVGHDGPNGSEGDDNYVPMLEQLAEASFALGIAIGLRLRPEMFGGGQ